MFILNRDKFENADCIFEATDPKYLTNIISSSNLFIKINNISIIRFKIISMMLSINHKIHDIENDIYNLDNIVDKNNINEIPLINEIECNIRHKIYLCACDIFKLSILIYLSAHKYSKLEILRTNVYYTIFVKFRELVNHLNYLCKRSWKHLLILDPDIYPYESIYTNKLIGLRHYSTFNQIMILNLYC